MPREILQRREYNGQVWYDPVPQPVDTSEVRPLPPSHMEKGVSTSPLQTDEIHRRTEG